MQIEKNNTRSKVVSFALIGLASAAILAPATNANARNLLEILFGSPGPAVQQRTMHDDMRASSYAPSQVREYNDPVRDWQQDIERRVSSRQSSQIAQQTGVKYCVRSCDGKYFPVRADSAKSAETLCNAFCPASATKIYSGSTIDNAYDKSGNAYAKSQNAFAYREKLVDGCTCDGKSPAGLARVDIKLDDTLQRGDIVATNKGLVAYAGERKNQQAFKPIASARIVPASTRRALEDVKIRTTTTTLASNIN